jgi:hypothetical protein
MCIHFGCPTKKTELVGGLPWRGRPWPSSSSMAAMGARPETEGRGGGRRGGEGGAGGGGSTHGSSCVRSPCLYMKKKVGRRKEKRRERKKEEGKEKKRKHKNGNIFQTWKFLERKIKDNL